MTNRFLISAAVAALIAGTGFANAQGTGTRAGASGGAATSRPRRRTGRRRVGHDAARYGGASGMKGAESTDTKGSGFVGHEGIGIQREDAGQQERAGHQIAGREKSKSMSSETETKGGKDMKAEGRDTKSGAMNSKSASDTRARPTARAAT